MKPKGKKLKIVHVGNHTTPCIGGIETVIWEISRTMSEKGHSVEIVTFDQCARATSRLPAREIIEGIVIHRLPMRRLGFYLFPGDALLPLIQGADIIHVHGLGGWLDWLALNRHRYAGSVFVNSHGGVFHTAQRGLFKRIYLHAWLPFASRIVSGMLYDSESDAAQLRPFVHAPSLVIPNGIVLPKAVAKSKQDSRVPHFIFVGRMSRNKRVEDLLRTFARLHQQKIPFHLDIIGEDWEGLRAGLENEAREHGLSARVTFHGGIGEKELRSLYARADYFVSASAYEGFGISAIEGMAAGCIPILNRIPTFQSFIGEPARGLLVDFASPDAAAAAIIQFLGLTTAARHRIRQAARAFAETFSWDSIAEKQLEFYAHAMRKSDKDQHAESASP